MYDQERRYFFENIFFVVIQFLIVFIIVAKQMEYNSDYLVHAQIAAGVSKNDILHFGRFLREHGYLMWQFLTKILLVISNLPLKYAAAFVTASCSSLLYISSWIVFRKWCRGVHVREITRFHLLLFLVGPIYIPWYNEWVFKGQDSPNVWHNPTHFMVKPFAFIAFILIIWIVNQVKEYDYQKNISLSKASILAMALVFANLSKPSFTQILYPALVIWMLWLLWESRGKVLKTGVQLACACLPGFFLLVYQLTSTFGDSSSEGGMKIAFMEYWRTSSPNVAVSVLLVILFPLVILCLATYKKVGQEDLRLAWLMFLVGAVEKAVLIETGSRVSHGNFGWGYSLGCFFIWWVAVKYYLLLFWRKDISKRSWKYKEVFWGLTSVILILHLMGGVFYLYQLLTIPNFIC